VYLKLEFREVILMTDGHVPIQVFGNMDTRMEEHDMEKVKHYTKKYCPTPTWCHFSGCCVFFLRPLHSTYYLRTPDVNFDCFAEIFLLL